MIEFLVLAWRTYRKAEKTGRPQYAAVTNHGVPQIVVFVGVGREAWRVTHLAIEGWKK